ncbi:BTAD domain-containing putative transcriptional regulator [Alloiococcus sp. CFN-8]|uniref:BTAD domain-containing putative transcriptional regulator n=1 Tax=Alloiococcus sp. CFN-8 TaxID=3416081 RepID=UPI003CE68216
MENKILEKQELDLMIYTFDRFEILYKGVDLTLMFSKYPRIFSLLKFFVLNKGKHLSSEYIEDNLWGESEYLDLKNTIKGQVFRLRKIIKKISSEFCGGSLEQMMVISFIDGCYILQLFGNCFLDFEDFEIKAKDLLSLGREKEDIYHDYHSILNLYPNHLLNNLALDHWVIPKRNYYKRLFMDIVNGMITILKERNDYKKAMEVIEKVMLIEPMEERLHIHFIEILLKQGKKYEALKHYNYTNNKLCKELGIIPSEDMKAIREEVYGSIYEKEDAQADLEEVISLVFKQKRVDINSFRRIFTLASRLKGKRKIKCAHMVITLEEQYILKLIREGCKDALFMVSKTRNDMFQSLINSISRTIRKGDVYYFDSFSLSFKVEVLLYDIIDSHWSIVSDRLLKSFREELPDLPLQYVNIKIEEI